MVFVALSYINHLRAPAQVLHFLKKIPEIIQGGKNVWRNEVANTIVPPLLSMK